jgi:phosphatidylserine decarboxylase
MPNSLQSRAALPATGEMPNLLALLIRLGPKNLASWWTGVVVRTKLPRPLAQALNRTFARTYGLALDEAELPLESYRTLEDLFTRRLKPGLRPLKGTVCSPADGYLARSEAARAGEAVQAKGFNYSLPELIGMEQVNPAELAWYQTIYLAPHNYHRVHAPFAGKVTAIRHLPGQLWPVNLVFVHRIARLFCRNERLVFDFELATGGRAYVVMVGALNVGRMTTPLAPRLVTNGLARQIAPRRATKAFSPPVTVAQGAELGTFMLGSTVVIVYDQEAMKGIRLVQAADNKPILMGQSLTGA